MSSPLPIPGPNNRLLGLEHFPRLLNDLLGTTSQVLDRYGDVAQVSVAGIRLVMLRHPDHLHEVLVQRSDVFVRERRIQSIFAPWLGQGILLSDGPEWRRQRPPIQHAWQMDDTQRAVDAARHHTQRLLLSRLGERFDFAEVTERLAFSVMLEMTVGVRDTARADELFEAATVLQEAGIYRTTDLFPLPRWFPTPSNRRYQAALRDIIGLLDDTIRRTEPGANCLVGRLRAAEQAGTLSPLEVRYALANLLFGGKETAGASLLFTLYLLAQHQTEQTIAANEVDSVLAGRSVVFDDLPRLSLLQRVYLESLRLYPAVPILSRLAAETVSLGGYKIPKNAHLMLSVWSMQRDARWFDDPLQFRPDRFLPEHQQQMKPHSFLPFGAGVHVCIGRQLAMQEAAVMLATLLPSATVQLPPGSSAPRLKADLRLHPIGPLELMLVPRAEAARQLEPGPSPHRSNIPRQ